MKSVWFAADSIISPLGLTTTENYEAVRLGLTGISKSPIPGADKFFAASLNDELLQRLTLNNFTRFESLAIRSVLEAIRNISIDLKSSRTAYILSTTKGNIDLIDEDRSRDKLSLSHTARRIFQYIRQSSDNEFQPYVISNACISGMLAVTVASRLLKTDQFDHAIVVGCDILTEFVVSGFNSLMAISDEPCRPYDKNRKGISLGEAAACLVLTTKPEELRIKPEVRIIGDAITNDANHISGPSRTGKELANAINIAMKKADISPEELGFVSAHGTATLYNDEMEAKAFNQMALNHVPVNSLKGYFGHTLGAAGVVELAISNQALLQQELIPSMGFKEMGVSIPLNIITERKIKSITSCLKTASGFGGCNAAMVLGKI